MQILNLASAQTEEWEIFTKSENIWNVVLVNSSSVSFTFLGCRALGFTLDRRCFSEEWKTIDFQLFFYATEKNDDGLYANERTSACVVTCLFWGSVSSLSYSCRFWRSESESWLMVWIICFLCILASHKRRSFFVLYIFINRYITVTPAGFVMFYLS